MKQLLIRLSAGLLLTLATTVNLPAISQPSASPSATQGGDQFSNSPLFRGVTLTPQQKSQLLSIRKDADNQIIKLLTPAQKKIASTKGPRAVQFTKPQQEKIMVIAKKSSAKTEAVFTPEQIKQIKENIKALQGANGQAPGQK
jgi:Spy/CpxP family protein refolding chaperone